jgi:predicted PP-loop superfamily ATPase
MKQRPRMLSNWIIQNSRGDKLKSRPRGSTNLVTTIRMRILLDEAAVEVEDVLRFAVVVAAVGGVDSAEAVVEAEDFVVAVEAAIIPTIEFECRMR